MTVKDSKTMAYINLFAVLGALPYLCELSAEAGQLIAGQTVSVGFSVKGGPAATLFFRNGRCRMLSGESAAGKYPVEAVRTMASIAEYTEAHTDYKQRFMSTEYIGKNNLDCISHAVCPILAPSDARRFAHGNQ